MIKIPLISDSYGQHFTLSFTFSISRMPACNCACTIPVRFFINSIVGYRFITSSNCFIMQRVTNIIARTENLFNLKIQLYE